jgi:hypothetical protein
MKKNIISLLIAGMILIVGSAKLKADFNDGTLYFKCNISTIEKQNSIEKKFIGKPGIIDVYIDRSSEMFSILFDPFRLTDDDIYYMIQKSGYQIYIEKNPYVTLNEAFFKLNPKEAIDLNKIENSLKKEQNIVDVYFDTIKNQINILYISSYNDDKILINSLIKYGLKNPVLISNSDSKSLQTDTINLEERNL